MLGIDETGRKTGMSEKSSGQRAAPRRSGGWIPSDSGRDGGKLRAPAVERNTAPILEVLGSLIAETDSPSRSALELASGSGQHAIAFAENFPDIVWQPSERDPAGLESIAAWRAEAGHDNLLEPVAVDLDAESWFRHVAGPFDLLVTCNLLHISPWHVTLNLLAGAGQLLSPAGTLFVYGCFSRAGDFVSESNRSFDQSLRLRDPAWGVRDTDAVAEIARANALAVARIVPMPANNTALVMRRA
jgi:Protein of unknown function (DUF938)